MKTPLLALSLASLLFSGVAQAGALVIRDTLGTLKPDGVAMLQDKSSGWPFDVHVLIENAPDLQHLEDDAHAWVDGPKVVVVAVDPVHHKVSTRFGIDSGVKTGDFDAIASSGKTLFRAENYAGGILEIIRRSQGSAEAKVALTASVAPVTVEEHLSGGTWLALGLGAGIPLILLGLFLRKRKEDQHRFEAALKEASEEAAELRHANIRNMTAPEPKAHTPAPKAHKTHTPAPLPSSQPLPAYSSPRGYGPSPSYSAPAPVIVNNNGGSGNNDLVTGMMLGEMMSQPRRETVIREEVYVAPPPSGNRYTPAPVYVPTPAPPPPSVRPEPVYTPPAPSYSPPTPSYSSDSGGSSSSYSGSSSSYDSGSSSSSSYDSGGSSSSFDSGSSGGGSSDW